MRKAGSPEVLDIMRKIPALVLSRGLTPPEMSVTSNLPLMMNGGKDFCRWSKRDRVLATTISKLFERVFGRYDKGMVVRANKKRVEIPVRASLSAQPGQIED